MRNEGLENLILTGNRGKEEQRKATRDILDGLDQMDGRTSLGDITKRQNIRSYKRQEDMEDYDRLHP